MFHDKQGLINAGARQKSATVSVNGGSVRLLEMSGTARDEYDHYVSIRAAGNWRNIRAKLVQLCLVDEAGELMFGADEVEKLGDLSGLVLDKLFDECKAINGLNEEIEDVEKKS